MLIRYFGGEALVFVESQCSVDALSVMGRLDVPFKEMKRQDGGIEFKVPLYRIKLIKRDFDRYSIVYEIRRFFGFPTFLYGYRKRWGLMLGALLSAVMIWLSGRVIWCVNVTGNSTVPDGEIIEILESLGCGVGDFFGDIDFDVLHNRFLMKSDNIGWISVNMNGTHANVEVREIIFGKEETKEGGFYNVVAAEDGQIVRMAAVEGKPVCEIGDTVLRGELLISGAISYKEDTLSRFESAQGSVYANVLRNFSVNVPLKTEKKVYTGEKTVKKSLRFFKFNINLFVNSRISYEFCDTMIVNKQIYLFHSIPLPLFMNYTVYREYEIKDVTLSENEAKSLARAEYKKKLSEILGDAQIVRKTVSEGCFDGSYCIECELCCLADIALLEPLYISGSDETQNQTEETE